MVVIQNIGMQGNRSSVLKSDVQFTTAKDFLKSCSLSSDELSYLDDLDQYTLEALMIFLLGSLFHCIQGSPAVRVSTLIEHLSIYVKNQAHLLKARNIGLSPSWGGRPIE